MVSRTIVSDWSACRTYRSRRFGNIIVQNFPFSGVVRYRPKRPQPGRILMSRLYSRPVTSLRLNLTFFANMEVPADRRSLHPVLESTLAGVYWMVALQFLYRNTDL